MIGAPQAITVAICQETRGNIENAGGNQIGWCRGTELIGNNSNLVALGAKPQHRLQEILAIGPIHPGRPEDGVTRKCGANGVFAR